jgi:hypothetical protein
MDESKQQGCAAAEPSEAQTWPVFVTLTDANPLQPFVSVRRFHINLAAIACVTESRSDNGRIGYSIVACRLQRRGARSGADPAAGHRGEITPKRTRNSASWLARTASMVKPMRP